MTEDEQELKEKIVEILKKEIEYVVVCGSSVKNVCVDHIADALISSGYVADLPALIDGKMGIFVPDKGSMELYPVKIKEQLAVAEQRADIAEKSFNLVYEEASRYMRLSTKEWYCEMAKNIMEDNNDQSRKV